MSPRARWLAGIAAVLALVLAGRMGLRYLDWHASEAARAPAAAPAAPATGAALLDTHVHGFAMAHCLGSLSDKGLPETDARVLREQGGRWGQVLVERSRGDYPQFFVIMPAIDAAIAATPMALVRDDATGGSLTAPVFYCDMLLRQPEVMRAMAKARASLAPAYSDE